MTSLGKLVFIDQRTGDDDSYLTAEDQRLTLAYENLEEMPQNLVYNFGSFVRILDLSHNKFRLFVISWFPNLIHLDDRAVTEDQKNEAHRLFRRPFLERLSISTSRSSYLRVIQEKFVSFFGSVERYFPNAQNARNTVI
ncbi:Uncharacterized protein GBIM_12723 [Gryllus bimaculatus]|nr:Uncharacterized protein GBIM_12723 [Gryllus bimaculatus]